VSILAGGRLIAKVVQGVRLVSKAEVALILLAVPVRPLAISTTLMAVQHDRLSFLRPFALLASLGIVLCLLYFASAVLIPLALAVLLTFLLAPVVTGLQRRGLPRAPAVMLVVLAASALFAVVGWVVASQATTLVDTLPEYQENLDEKIATLRAMSQGGFVDKLQAAMDRIRREMNQPTDPESAAALEALKPQPQLVRIVPEVEGPFNLAELWSLAGPLLEPLAMAGVVVVLVIFLLIRREDMRDRLISLLGRGRLTLTTKALDEAGYRISRYLLMQFIINSSFGVAVAVGLFVIGVPYPLLWGFLATVLRYIPYIGPWLAALLPVALSMLITRGWTTPLAVVGMFLVLETTTNMFLEPWLYGKNVGVSDAASIVAIAFWTWLWGPIGLVLAFPLTVCLVVLGRYVPALKFFDVLLGDQPALEPHVGFYQRLLAHDEDEAAEIAEERLKQSSLEEVYDDVLAPALSYGRRDVDGDLISDDQQRTMLRAVREIADDLAEQSRAAALATNGDAPSEVELKLPRVAMLACPARDEADETALNLLASLIDPDKINLEITPSSLLTTEVASLVEQKEIKVVCIAALPPGGLAHARHLCKRLRTCCSDLKIIVGRFGLKSPLDKNREQLQSAGANYVTFSLAETKKQILALLPVVAAQKMRENEVSGTPQTKQLV
jgi:predicted PurR-regulated permease PerM